MKDPYKAIETPATEAEFQDFLNRHYIRYDRQVVIDKCPFNKSFTHRVDFYLFDFKLYVEVKGWMSCSAVSELWWLLNHCERDFYIYQATNEDWMGRCTGALDLKIRKNKNLQQAELKHLFEQGKGNSAEVKRLVAVNRQRLKDFITVRKYDVQRWKRALKQSPSKSEEAT